MARKVRNAELDTRAARTKLKARGKPYYQSIARGLHLGYRKLRGQKDGTWVVRHYVEDRQSAQGKRQPYHMTNLAQADDLSDANGVDVLTYQQACDKIRADRDIQVKQAAGVAAPLTVAQAMTVYLEYLDTNGQPSKDAGYRSNAFIVPTLGRIEVTALTAEKLRRWHADVAKVPARLRTKAGQKQRYRDLDGDDEEVIRQRRSSANRTLTTLKAALNHAFNHGKAPSDNAWRKVKPFKQVDAARVRYLKVAEAQRLLNASDPEFRPMVQAALETGARYGELARLFVSDFNLDSGTVAIRKSKSAKPRHVVLTEEGAAFFKQICAGRSGSERMFTRADGELWGKSHQKRPMDEACKAGRISPPASFHALRHTWASHAVMNGVPLLVVARNLGHTDTRMVEKHYGHLAPSYEADAIRAGAPRFGFKADEKVVAIGGR